MSEPTYHYHNSPSSPPPPSPLPATLTLTTPRNTDIWRKPPTTDDFTGPILYRTIPLSALKSARVTIRANWTTQFDQGGLILAIDPPPADDTTGKSAKQWVKTGIEFFEGQARVSTVACDRWSDWSLVSLSEGEASATIELEREVTPDGSKTSTLWVYVRRGEVRQPLREVAWMWEADVTGGADKEAWIGLYAARPNKEVEGDLDVEFEGFEVESF